MLITHSRRIQRFTWSKFLQLAYWFFTLYLFIKVNFSLNVCPNGLLTVGLRHTTFATLLFIANRNYTFVVKFSLLCDTNKLFYFIFIFFCPINVGKNLSEKFFRQKRTLHRVIQNVILVARAFIVRSWKPNQCRGISVRQKIWQSLVRRRRWTNVLKPRNICPRIFAGTGLELMAFKRQVSLTVYWQTWTSRF